MTQKRLKDLPGQGAQIDFIEAARTRDDLETMWSSTELDGVCLDCPHMIIEGAAAHRNPQDLVSVVRHTFSCSNFWHCPDHPQYDAHLASASKDEVDAERELRQLLEEEAIVAIGFPDFS